MSINIKAEEGLIKLAPTSYNELTDLPNINSIGDDTYITNESGENIVIINSSGLETTGIVVDSITLGGKDISQTIAEGSFSGDFNDLINNPFINSGDNLTIVDNNGNVGLLLDNSGLQVKDVYTADGHQLSQKADKTELDEITNTISVDDESGNLTIVDESGNIGLLLDESGLQVKDVYAGGHQLSQKADKTELETLSDIVTNLSNTKADKTEVNTLSNTVNELSGTVNDLTNTISVDDKSGNLTIVDGLGNIGLLLDESGLQVKDVYADDPDGHRHQLLQKANQTDLENLSSTVNTKADKSDLNTLSTTIGIKVTGPTSSVDKNVAIFDGTTGKVIGDSGYTIAGNVGTSVPADAKFTDTTYTFEDISVVDDEGRNIDSKFKVTSSDGSEQTINVYKHPRPAVKIDGSTLVKVIVDSYGHVTGFVTLGPDDIDGYVKYIVSKQYVDGLLNVELGDLSELTNAISIDDESTNLTIVDDLGNVGLILDNSGLQVKDVYTGNGKHQLSNKANQTDLENLSGTVNTLSGTVNTKADKSDLNTLSTIVGNKVTGPSSSVSNRVAVFDGTTGKLIKDSGYTIAGNVGTSVPSDAKFTDTTYSVMSGATSSAAGKSGLVPAPAKGEQAKFLRGDGKWIEIVLEDNTNTTYTFADGTNGFTVTPLGGSPQTVKVTPSIDKNVTYSGTLTSGRVATFDGTTGTIKDSGYTIAGNVGTSVPANAKFTDNNTTYTFKEGDNGKFTVTPSGGTAQTITAYEHYSGPIATDNVGLHKFSFNREGHITGWGKIEKADITNLGIPAQDTTYSNMTLDEAKAATSTEARTISANVLHNKIVATAATEPFTEEEIEAIIAELES